MMTRLQKGAAATVLLSLATLNYFNTSNNIVHLTDAPLPDLDEIPDPSNPALSRKLTHNTESDWFKKRQQKIAERRRKWKVANAQRRTEKIILRQREYDLKNQEAKIERVTKMHLNHDKTIHLRSDSQGQAQMRGFPVDSLSDEELAELTPTKICDRSTDLGSARDFSLLRQYSITAGCPGTTGLDSNSILLLEGVETPGQTGNNLIEFLHALQYSRDYDVQLGIMSGSWAMGVLLKMWMSVQDENEDHWIKKFEEAFCVKIFKSDENPELEGWNVIRKDTEELFLYSSGKPLDEYMASQGDGLRTLWSAYNDGQDNNMCSGIDAVFGENKRKAIYSVIHSRSLGGKSAELLEKLSKSSGCDPVAALEMRPDYIKSILRPLGMLHYPIVLITDGIDFDVIRRLMTDSEIGPQLRLVPEGASWVGGDLTIAMMGNVFIGNPASLLTGFIAKSRLAMGFGHNYLFRAKDAMGKWSTVCGDDCIFDRTVMACMA